MTHVERVRSLVDLLDRCIRTDMPLWPSADDVASVRELLLSHARLYAALCSVLPPGAVEAVVDARAVGEGAE